MAYQYCQQRFNFWLEDRPFSSINDSLLFDICSDQWGHSSYTTTRKSYLHGTEWLPRFFSNSTCYEYDELRYLLSIKPDSRDIFRFIKTIEETHPNANQKNNTICLLEQEMMCLLLYKKPFKHLTHNAYIPLILESTTDITPLEQWKQHYSNTSDRNDLMDRTKICKSTIFHYQSEPFFELIENGTLPFPTISKFWSVTGKHQRTSIPKTQLNDLKQLGTMAIDPDSQSLTLATRCTLNNAILFTRIFRTPFFSCFTFSFLLEHNRKTPVSNNKTLVNTHFSKADEHVDINIIQQGKTQLIISMQFNLDSPWLLQSVFDYLKQ